MPTPTDRDPLPVRTTAILAAACVAASACSSAFSSGSGSGADAAPEGDATTDGGIVVVNGEGGADGTTKDAAGDGGHDATLTDARDDGDARDLDAGDEGDATGKDSGGCGTGFLACDGGCVPDNLENCGTCGHDCADLSHVTGPVTCTPGGACSFPESSCATGWLHCTSNPDDGCETSSTTTSNCGGCGVSCEGGTPLCNGTSCISSCTGKDPTLCDGGVCVNTTNDPQNCNGCGITCPDGPANSSPTCTASVCGWACNAHTLECGGTSCLPQVPDSTAGVFVSAGGPKSSCGDIAAPCGTLTAALKVLALSGGAKTIVYVAESSTPYTEQLTLPAGVTIQGGWVYAGAGKWSRPCALDATQVVISAPAGADRTVIASFNGTSTLDTLTIENENTATAGTATTPGQTLYGIFAANATSGQTNLVLTNVDVNVAAGGAGGTGSQGGAGSSPPGSCSAGTTGADGTPGALGPGAGAGTYDVDGYHPAMGSTGTIGNPGDNGTAAPAKGQTGGPSCLTEKDSCCTGSNGCTSCGSNPPSSCSTRGSNGCASGASAGGGGGTGAGASLGVFAWNVTVQVTGASIAVSDGGSGGSGGPGGNVVAGSAGSPGAASNPVVVNCTQPCNGTVCRCDTTGVDDRRQAAAGAAGGQGGKGGVGGQGGGGSGGDSFCFYAGGTSTPPATGLSCTFGMAASGGNAGLSDQGATGSVGQNN